MDGLFHDQTRKMVEAFIAAPTHSVLLHAPLGSGKQFIAQSIAAQLLGSEPDKLIEHPYFLLIQPQNNSISINEVRELKAFTQLKTAGQQQIRRVIIVEGADFMTDEAQNALLKVLEEPPADTVVILTADFTSRLLPTIQSRVQAISVKNPARAKTVEFFKRSHPEDVVIKAYHMSGGRVGIMHALLHDEAEHPLKQQIEIAKQLLSKPVYERLLMMSDLTEENLLTLHTALYSVAHAALQSAIDKNNERLVRRWYHTCKVIYESQNILPRKPQTKLLLTNLLVNL
jgi:DNA polymerase III delta prime subunit